MFVTNGQVRYKRGRIIMRRHKTNEKYKHKNRARLVGITNVSIHYRAKKKAAENCAHSHIAVCKQWCVNVQNDGCCCVHHRLSSGGSTYRTTDVVAFIIDSALIAVIMGVGIPISFNSVTTDTGFVLDTMAPSNSTFNTSVCTCEHCMRWRT